MKHDVKDLKLAPEGKRRIEWANSDMPVLQLIKERFEKEKTLDGLKISACLHVTAETANLVRTLKAGGAQVVKREPTTCVVEPVKIGYQFSGVAWLAYSSV